MKNTAFLDFVKYSLSSEMLQPPSSVRIDWMQFFNFCYRQGIIGIVFYGLKKSNLKIDIYCLSEWIASAERIKKQNNVVKKRILKLTKFFHVQGIRSCILKGQANGLMYPQPDLRSPGDIDIWVEGSDAEIIKKVLSFAPYCHYEYHHIDMPIFDDVSVEIHYRPAYMYDWAKNNLLQKYIKQITDEQFGNRIAFGDSEICVLTDTFNALALMIHMYGHFFSTRNNLKQLIDYYYLLKRGFTKSQRKEIVDKFKVFGVMKYARGIMWIEQYVLGLNEKFLLVDTDEKIGRLLLNETLHYGEKRGKRSRLGVIVHRIINNLHIFWHFPFPVLITPIYLIWHQWWKWNMKRKLKP